MNPDIFENLNYFHKHSSSIPYCIQISSSNPGSHVVIVGGTHGNETAGLKAIVRLHQAFGRGDIPLKRGKISFLLGNPEAYRKNVRYVDYDLNRAFVQSDTSTVEGRRASEITTFLADNEDINALLDLHSVSIGDFKIVVYTRANPDNSDLAVKLSSIGLHFAFLPEHMPGTLIHAASIHNICGLIVECGNHLSAHGRQTALEHIYRILTHYHLIDGAFMMQTATPEKITRYESIQAIKPHSNFTFLIQDIQTGTRVKKGQKFAGDDHGDHIAPLDCHVVVPSRVVKPTDIDAGFLATRTVQR